MGEADLDPGPVLISVKKILMLDIASLCNSLQAFGSATRSSGICLDSVVALVTRTQNKLVVVQIVGVMNHNFAPKFTLLSKGSHPVV